MNPTDQSFRILIADDDLGTRELLSDYLRSAGHRVELAENGLEAVKLMERQKFQIVIVDWIMPVMDGPHVCRWIRQRAEQDPVHIIMLTIYNEQARLVEAFDAGVDDFLSKPVHEGELMARMRAWTRIIRLEESLAARNKAAESRGDELADLNTRLAHLAAFDELTGLPNRREAMSHLRDNLVVSQRYGHPLACSSIDVDHFKSINDGLGHAAGDWVLRQVSQELRRGLRDADGLFRLGGDELLAILPHQTVVSAGVCLERCRAAIAAREFIYEGKALNVTISAGVAERGPNIQTPEDMLKAADDALYAAKNQGRNRLHIRSA